VFSAIWKLGNFADCFPARDFGKIIKSFNSKIAQYQEKNGPWAKTPLS